MRAWVWSPEPREEAGRGGWHYSSTLWRDRQTSGTFWLASTLGTRMCVHCAQGAWPFSFSNTFITSDIFWFFFSWCSNSLWLYSVLLEKYSINYQRVTICFMEKRKTWWNFFLKGYSSTTLLLFSLMYMGGWSPLPAEARRGQWLPWSWGCVGAGNVSGAEHQSSARAACALNHWPVCAAQETGFCYVAQAGLNSQSFCPNPSSA